MEKGTSYNSVSSWDNQITSYRVSHFYLVYGTEAFIPIDLVWPVVKLAEIAGIAKEDILEIIKEKRNNATSHNRLYQVSIKARCEGQVKERKFQVGELVWKIAPYV